MLSRALELLPSRNELVTFMLATQTDIYAEQRHRNQALESPTWYIIVSVSKGGAYGGYEVKASGISE